jgi:serine/threonine protein kinase
MYVDWQYCIFIPNCNHLIAHAFAQVALQITRTLGAVHMLHIVHKDLKPQNILLNAGQMRVELMVRPSFATTTLESKLTHAA